MTIGEAIRAARESKGYSRARLANKAHVSAVTIQFWEEGRTMPSINLLMCVADILAVTLDELVGRKVKGE